MAKKKTHEEYANELAIKNPNIEVVGKYVNTDVKIEHRCLKHNINWETTPKRALSGIGCEECKKEKFRKIMRKTHEDYVEELKTVNSNIIVLEEYINAKTLILHKCILHNIEWMALPTNILQGHGCWKCGNEKIGDKNSKSHEQYVEELKIINSNIEVIGTYVDANTPIEHKCKIDGYIWKTSPGNILYGTGCPKCSGNMKKSHSQYLKEVFSVNPKIEVIDTYINAKTPILHKCKIDKHEWNASPYSILSGNGCPKCAKNIKKTHEQYMEELKIVNPDIDVIEKYINANTPILHKCNIDKHEWMAIPSTMLSYGSCPVCKETCGERLIRQWLESRGIKYKFQHRFDDCKDVNCLPFDFYLPDYNIAIEYDGVQHYKSIDFFGGEETFIYTKKHDNIKTEYCKNNNIKLLRIPYFKNVEEELNNFLFI